MGLNIIRDEAFDYYKDDGMLNNNQDMNDIYSSEKSKIQRKFKHFRVQTIVRRISKIKVT